MTAFEMSELMGVSEIEPDCSGFNFLDQPVTEYAPEHPAISSLGPASHATSVYGPRSFHPALLESSAYGPPMLFSSLPYNQLFIPPIFSTNGAEPGIFLPAPLPQPDPTQIDHSQPSACHITHAKYMKWTHTVYDTSVSPYAFVQAWEEAFREMKQTFGRPHLPAIYVLNQFLTAVSVNPHAIPWVQSLQFQTGPLPASILDEAFVDFLEFEAHRLGIPDFPIASVLRTQPGLKQYCPFHQRPTRHSIGECYRNPQNMRRKRRWRRRQAQMAAVV